MKTRGIAKWVNVTKLDTKYEPQWNLLVEVDKEEYAKLKGVGLSPKLTEDDEGNIIRSIRFSRRLKRKGKKGGQNPPPTVVDAALEPYDGEIGNGSEVVVLHRPFPWNNEHGKGVSSDLQGVQILSLVEYVPEEGDEDEEVIEDDGEGFEVMGEGLKGGTKKEEGVGELDF